MIARVFPRQTKATPVDEYAFVGEPPLFLPEDITEVHVSVVFTWDLPEAKRLARACSRIAPVKIGGPATGMKGENFTPGMYLKPGYVITSRGCPNNCWFCSVPKREGRAVRELPIMDVHNVLDDNLLACSFVHFEKVILMLANQKKSGKNVLFTGGLEAKRLRKVHVAMLKDLRPKRIFFAYDEPRDLAPLEKAMKLFREFNYCSRNTLYCYVLVGFRKDTMQAAEERLKNVVRLGMTPMAMLYRDESNAAPSSEWRRFQRAWARPGAIYAKERKMDYLTSAAKEDF